MPRGKKKIAPEGGDGSALKGPDFLERKAAFLVYMDQMRAARMKSVAANEAYKAVKKVETKVRNEAKAAFAQGNAAFLKIVDRILEREGQQRVDQHAEAELEAFMMTCVGQPVVKVTTQQDFFAKVTYDDDWWFAVGRQGALANKDQEELLGPCPPEHRQALMKGHIAGQEDIAWAMAEKGHNPEARRKADPENTGHAGPVPLEPEPEDEPDDQGGGDDSGESCPLPEPVEAASKAFEGMPEPASVN